MTKKIVGIVGSYRKNRVIDTAVSEVLRGAESRGAETSRIYLIDKPIEFCTNCRTCCQEEDISPRAKCIQDDDMDRILAEVDSADGLVLGAPANVFNVTAVTRRFMERLSVYVYWPWQAHTGPGFRIKKPNKKAAIVMSTACPAFLGRIFIRGPHAALKTAAKTMGAKVQTRLYFGKVAQTPEATLDERSLLKAYRAGEKLAG